MRNIHFPLELSLRYKPIFPTSIIFSQILLNLIQLHLFFPIDI
jgi:hypothetical protein